MHAFRAFTVSFCTVCVLTAGVFLILPRDKTEKSVKYLFSLLFLCSMISVLPGFWNMHFSFPESHTAQKGTSLSETAARQTFALALEQAGIPYRKIEVCTNILPDGGIGISKVIVYSSAEETEIRQTLGGDAAEYEVVVIRE